MFAYFRKLRIYKRTRKELNSLTRRELDDIGINLGDIDRIAMEAFDHAA